MGSYAIKKRSRNIASGFSAKKTYDRTQQKINNCHYVISDRIRRQSGTGKKYLPPTTTTNGVNDQSYRICHVFNCAFQRSVAHALRNRLAATQPP
jgi:hypothetical protein